MAKVKYAPRTGARGKGRQGSTHSVHVFAHQRAHWVAEAKKAGISQAVYIQGLIDQDIEEKAHMARLLREVKKENREALQS